MTYRQYVSITFSIYDILSVSWSYVTRVKVEIQTSLNTFFDSGWRLSVNDFRYIFSPFLIYNETIWYADQNHFLMSVILLIIMIWCWVKYSLMRTNFFFIIRICFAIDPSWLEYFFRLSLIEMMFGDTRSVSNPKTNHDDSEYLFFLEREIIILVKSIIPRYHVFVIVIKYCDREIHHLCEFNL